MTTLAILLAAAMVVAPAAPQAEIRNVRIFTPKIQAFREKTGSDVTVGGQIRVDMFFSQRTVRKPVMRMVCLCEADGELTVHTVFLDRPRTCDGMSRSAILSAFKNAGVEVSYKERDAYLSDPAKFTPFLPEVTKDAYTAAVYGAVNVRHGFFRLGRSQTLPKVLLYRIEIWQNGVCAASCDSSRTGLGAYEIPADWHLWKKYPQKFKYADIR